MASESPAHATNIWDVVGEWGGLLLLPVAGWLGKQFHAWQKRRARRAELLEALGEAASLAMDLERFRFQYGPDSRSFETYLDDAAHAEWEKRGRNGQSPREQWGDLKKRTLETRDQVWHARGFKACHSEDTPEELAEKHEENERMRRLKLTGRWKAGE